MIMKVLVDAHSRFNAGRVCFDPAEIAAIEEREEETVVILKAGEHLQLSESYDAVLNACNIPSKRCE